MSNQEPMQQLEIQEPILVLKVFLINEIIYYYLDIYWYLKEETR